MKKIRKNAAGIDIGAKKVFVYVEDQKVESFFTFTEDFEKLCSYLFKHKVKTVAMEATGVYWYVLYEILEEAGIDVWLVDGGQTKQVPGRKTDVKDCQWIQELHSHGLLRRCFVVKKDIKELRSYHRLREDHIRSAATRVRHMQKALTEMNIRLTEVLSQVHGASGTRMIEAILDGERDRKVLLNMCDRRIVKNKKDDVLKALKGKYTGSGLFALKHAYEGYNFFQKLIYHCDKEIEKIIHRMGNGKKDEDLPVKRKRIRHNKPNIENMGANLLEIFQGKDAATISGINDYSWIQLLSETGTDLSKWPSEKHFTSWLGLSPGQHWSGKMRRNRRKKGNPKTGQIFRQIAQSILNSKKIALGAFGRKLRARKGPGIAIKAVARKLAEQYWRLMVKGVDFVEYGIKNYEEQIIARKRKSLEKLALELNMDITNSQHLTL